MGGERRGRHDGHDGNMGDKRVFVGGNGLYSLITESVDWEEFEGWKHPTAVGLNPYMLDDDNIIINRDDRMTRGRREGIITWIYILALRGVFFLHTTSGCLGSVLYTRKRAGTCPD